MFCLKQSCCLSWYKSIEDKKLLLDQAINTLDGNCIMAVILFIKKTVDECKPCPLPGEYIISVLKYYVIFTPSIYPFHILLNNHKYPLCTSSAPYSDKDTLSIKDTFLGPKCVLLTYIANSDYTFEGQPL